jgi:ABC-2 type transport system permease protein
MTLLFARMALTRWWRDGRLRAALVATAAALVLATSWATAGDIARSDARVAAMQQARTAWESTGDVHPHRMAHFGDFVFRPSGPLARLDRGVQARLGKVLRVEAHHQGAPFRSDASEAGSLARFDRLDAAFLLQVLVPLLLVFLGGTGLAIDRQTGRLELALVQGARASALLGGRLLALWGVGLALLALVVLASLGTSIVLDGDGLVADRLLAFLLVHALFFAVVSAGILAAALWLREARGALVALLAAWVLGTSVAPRATAGLATALVPLPSQDAFQAGLRQAREAGPDGHNPMDARLDALKAEVLAKYGVDTVEELPIDFGGMRMQADEDFGNQVWDAHYGALADQMRRQSSVVTLAGLANPFQAVDVLSMALAGTDTAHDIDFQQQAEAYRRGLVASLNDEHTHGRAKVGESGASVASFYAGLDGFTYAPPTVDQALQPRLLALVGLTGWWVLLSSLLARGAARLERGTLP